MPETATRIRQVSRATQTGKPVWDIALLYPTQGSWTESEYLSLELRGGRLIELANGCLEVLPMPTMEHQRILKLLYRRLDDFVTENEAGEVYFAPLPVHITEGTYREPDLVFIKSKHIDPNAKYPECADLVMEILSPGESNRRRDEITKRQEYERARIGEYWIVDPTKRCVTVLQLRGKNYRELGSFGVADQAKSHLLNGFSISVAELFSSTRTRRVRR